jgi:hypothetical protein
MEAAPAGELCEDFDFSILGDLLEEPEEGDDAELPPVSEEMIWVDRTRDLLRYLAKAKNGGSWRDLECWAAQHDVRFDDLRNQVVVLEQREEAEPVGDGQALVWRATPYGRRAAGRA